jgi:hypothetical protein
MWRLEAFCKLSRGEDFLSISRWFSLEAFIINDDKSIWEMSLGAGVFERHVETDG